MLRIDQHFDLPKSMSHVTMTMDARKCLAFGVFGKHLIDDVRMARKAAP